MRRRQIVPVFLLVAVAGLGAVPQEASAEQDPAVYFAQAIGRVAGQVTEATKKNNFGYNDGLSLFGGFMQLQGSTALNQELIRGNRYAIVGGGDDDATDLDLEIYDSNGKLVAVDRDNDSTPVAVFNVERTGYYRIKLSLPGARAKACFCAMAVLKDGGWNVPADNMIKACVGALAARGKIANNGLGLKFHDVTNQWSFFGGVLREKQEVELNTISLGDGFRVVCAAADDHSLDLDLKLSNERGVVAQDVLPDTKPVVQHQATAGRSYKVKVINSDSRGAAMVAAIILSE